MLMRLIGLVLFAAVLLLEPRFGEAQPSASIPRLGYLVLAPLSEPPSPERAAFLDGLRELGWVDGKTIAIVYRSAKWNPELFDDAERRAGAGAHAEAGPTKFEMVGEDGRLDWSDDSPVPASPRRPGDRIAPRPAVRGERCECYSRLSTGCGAAW
ncbi:MAG TPA: hypothetical protein VKG20_01125 [Methylomirabilota bacterium]|nr:hypothetical protein [Methylomirabilota bacterium]